MIYIVGFTFTVGRVSAPKLQGGSVLQQLNENRRTIVQSDCPLDVGSTYRLSRIKPVISEKKITELEYQFTNTSTGEDKFIKFSTVGAAETFIARTSGNMESYKKQKDDAARAMPEL